MKKLLTTLSLFFFLTAGLIAQTDNEHHSSAKETGIYEVITSGIYSYSLAHKEGLIGSEVHFTYWFSHKWGAGLSYTARFAEEAVVQDIALLGSMNPTNWLTLNVGLNLGLPSEVEHRDFHLGAYTEAEINIRPTPWFHFGPLVGAVLSQESEATVGIQLGFEF